MLQRIALPALVVLALAAFASIAAAETVVDLEDPQGDDHGDGRFVYPSQLGMRNGDLDVVGFKVENKGDKAEFTVEFDRKINQPQRGAAD